MSYEVLFDPEAIDFLSNLEKSIKERIYDKIMVSSGNPNHFFERLEGRKDYKLRVGSYRVIADIDYVSKKIVVTLIGHRRNVYDKLERS